MTGEKPLSEYAFDELVDALIAGQVFELPQVGKTLELSADSRVALAFYRTDPRYWISKTQVREEIGPLLNALKAGKIPNRRTTATRAATVFRWRLSRIKAHRFAGLHRHCNAVDGSDPPDFEWKVDRDLSLILGANGAGKSSLLSAISWVLTGRAIRSQSDPEEIHEPMGLTVPGAPDGEEESERQLSVPPVVPVPTAVELAALQDVPVINDTWVELEFVPIDGGPSVVVSRSLVEKRGKISAPADGLAQLGLSQTALEVGTIMPAVATQMRFDKPTELGKAVAELTGMKPLVEFGKRIPRVIERLEGREVSDTQNKMSEIVDRFRSDASAYMQDIAGLDALKPPHDLVPPGGAEEPGCGTRLEAAKAVALEGAQSSLDGMKALLGVEPKLDKAEIDRLLNAIDAAEAKLVPSELAILPTARDLLRPIAKGQADADVTQREIAEVLEEAKRLAERLQNESEAKRWQLYARVALWHEHHHPGQPFEVCPVCGTDLESVPKDALIDQGVREALEEAQRAGADLAKTTSEWVADRATAFLAKLPPSIRHLMECDWSTGLTPLYAKAITQELLGKSEFKGALQALTSRAKDLWVAVEADLPAWVAPAPVSLPTAFPKGSPLERALNQAAIVTALIQFRIENKAAFEAVFARVVGKVAEQSPEFPSDPADVGKLPLATQLSLLRNAASAALPAAEAGGKVDKLMALLEDWDRWDDRLDLLDRTAEALRPFIDFPALIEEQVGGLLADLEAETKRWVNKIYKGVYLDAPGFAGIDENGGVLGLRASVGGVVAPAHQVLNASALRAHVWGVLFALWKRVWEKHGGLSLILLDDPQQLFDPKNAGNFASAMPSLLGAGVTPVLASNDDHFVELVKLHLRARGREDRASLLYISPISTSNLVAALAPQRDAVERSRAAWEKAKNDVPAAQDFVADVRKYIEARLRDLLIADQQVLDQKATLSDFLSRIGELHNQAQQPFDQAMFKALVSMPQLQKGHPFYDCVNQALHARARDLGPTDAEVVAEHFDDVVQPIDICAQAYARFMGRLPAEDVRAALPPAFQPPAPPTAALSRPLLELPPMAARLNVDAISEATTGTPWDLTEIGGVALYAIGTHTLGLACLVGQTAIVDPAAGAKPGDLVIALNGGKAFARRLAFNDKVPDWLVLEAVPVAGKVPETYFLPRHSTRLMKVIGVLYDRHTGVKGEAKRVEVSEALRTVRFVAPVTDDSAYPAIPSGSRILLSPLDSLLLKPEDINALEGRAIAVAVSESTDVPDDAAGYLKRLGPALPGYPAVRALENIGAVSGCLHVHFATLGEAPAEGIPSVRQLWRVNGVLFR